MPEGYMGERGQSLTDAFFHSQDQKLLDQFREHLSKRERRAQLAQASGIHDDAVLDHLLALNVGPEALAAMTLIPLIQVAWADGQIQAEERQSIIAAAKQAGLHEKEAAYSMLEHWLAANPGRELVNAWKAYTAALCKQLKPAEIAELKDGVLDLARRVAQSAGGFLGLGSRVSKAEQSVLDDLAKSFA